MTFNDLLLKNDSMEFKGRLLRALCFVGLVFSVLWSAIVVVESVHSNRLLFAELQRLHQAADESRVEWGKLLLEQSSYAAYSRIENLANRQLKMKAPSVNEIVMVGQ